MHLLVFGRNWIEYKDRFEVVFIDVWENPDEAEAYKIDMIPTQIFYDANSKEQYRHGGFYSKKEILNYEKAWPATKKFFKEYISD